MLIQKGALVGGIARVMGHAPVQDAQDEATMPTDRKTKRHPSMPRGWWRLHRKGHTVRGPTGGRDGSVGGGSAGAGVAPCTLPGYPQHAAAELLQLKFCGVHSVPGWGDAGQGHAVQQLHSLRPVWQSTNAGGIKGTPELHRWRRSCTARQRPCPCMHTEPQQQLEQPVSRQLDSHVRSCSMCTAATSASVHERYMGVSALKQAPTCPAPGSNLL